jgi:hypothetical protein
VIFSEDSEFRPRVAFTRPRSWRPLAARFSFLGTDKKRAEIWEFAAGASFVRREISRRARPETELWSYIAWQTVEIAQIRNQWADTCHQDARISSRLRH